jgi:hypothetical protein
MEVVLGRKKNWQRAARVRGLNKTNILQGIERSSYPEISCRSTRKLT